MAGLSTWFNWSRGDANDELPDIFPLDITKNQFIETDTIAIFSKILTDVVERTHGLADDQKALLWDNCLMSNSRDGLITLLAWAMSTKSDLFLVYDEAVEVIREATFDEQKKIEADYKETVGSDVGVFVSFKNYDKSDVIKLYSGMEFSTIASLSKSMNLAKAIQFKMGDMRSAVAVASSDEIVDQAKRIAKGLAKGKDVILDGKDEIVNAMPDLTAVKEAISFIETKRSFYLGLPESYINGVQTGGLGTTGENDTKAIERGLRNYFFSIVKPVLEALFDVKLKYKTQDFRQIDQALEALKTFSITEDDLINRDNKRMILETLLDIDPDDNDPDEAAQPVLQIPANRGAPEAAATANT